MDVVRWKFLEVETSLEYTVEINPNKMSSYRFSREYDWARHDQARMRGVRSNRQPKDWTFGGVVRTETHHDALIEWQRKPGKVRVTDHLGRVFEVMMRSVDMIDRRPSGDNTWRFEYQFNCLLLRRIA